MSKPSISRHSMSGAILNKGLRVVVYHPDGADGETLASHLKRIGFKVQAFWPPLEELPDQTDLVFQALLPQEREPQAVARDENAPPLIAVISHEIPTFIDQSWKMGAVAVLTTPIRTAGLLSTIIFAMQQAKHNKALAQRISKLEGKLLGSRRLTQAQNVLIRLHKVTETAAYEILRSQAMAKRVSVDDICISIIQADELFSPVHTARE